MLWSGAGFTEPDLIEIKDIFSHFDAFAPKTVDILNQSIWKIEFIIIRLYWAAFTNTNFEKIWWSVFRAEQILPRTEVCWKLWNILFGLKFCWEIPEIFTRVPFVWSFFLLPWIWIKIDVSMYYTNYVLRVYETRMKPFPQNIPSDLITAREKLAVGQCVRRVNNGVQELLKQSQCVRVEFTMEYKSY